MVAVEIVDQLHDGAESSGRIVKDEGVRRLGKLPPLPLAVHRGRKRGERGMDGVAENAHGGGLRGEATAAPGFRPEDGEEADGQQTGGLRGVEEDAATLLEPRARDVV